MAHELNQLRRTMLASFKSLLRAQQQTFANDPVHIRAAAKYTREQFLKNKDVSDPAKLAELIKVAQDAQTIVIRNVVQGMRKSSDPDTYTLRMTPDKELGSNDSIKLAGSSKGSGSSA
eukprot:jgi/Hompol1/4126/HPOL_006969-RA